MKSRKALMFTSVVQTLARLFWFFPFILNSWVVLFADVCCWFLCHCHGDENNFAAALEGNVRTLMDSLEGQSSALVTLTLRCALMPHSPAHFHAVSCEENYIPWRCSGVIVLVSRCVSTGYFCMLCFWLIKKLPQG